MKKTNENEVVQSSKRKVKKKVTKNPQEKKVTKKSSKNKLPKEKGFTLVELLAVIAIIGILSLVAIGVYNGVSKNSKQKAYESKVEQIKTSAAKWARENNVDKTTTISVNKLVVEGYLTADESTDNGLSKIVNPTNNENMICKIVELKYKNGEILTEYIESSNNCSLAEQALDDKKITAILKEKVPNTSPTLNSNNQFSWTNQPVSLIVSSSVYDSSAVSITYDYEGNSIEKQKTGSAFYNTNPKTTSYAENPDGYYNVFNIDADVIYDGNITITYKLTDGSSKSKTVNVRIDKEEATASVIAKAEWVTANQKVVIKTDDGNGSGPAKLYVGTGDNYKANSVKPLDLCSNGKCVYEKEYEVPSVGEYNIWTEDKAGNISKYPKNKISVNNIDTTRPDCSINFDGTKGESDWYISEVIPRVTTTTAGISGLYFGLAKENTKNYSNYIGYSEIGNVPITKQGDTKGQKYTCAVKSLAGLSADHNAIVKVDTVKPAINSFSISSQSNSYKTNVVNVSLNAVDATSEVAKMCIQTSSDVNSCSWQNYSTSSTASTGISHQYGGTVRFYAWVKDNAGWVSQMKESSDYTVYRSCSQSNNIINNGSYTCAAYGACSNVCGGGTQYATKTQPKKDKFTGDACTSEVTSNGCSQSCGGKKVSNRGTCSIPAGATCSVTCGTGTKSGTRTISYVSTIDGSSCGTSSESCQESCTVTDNQAPTINSVTLTVTGASTATVSVSAKDKGCSGIKEYQYTLAGQTYTSTSSTYNFTGITRAGNYQATVTVTDHSGNHSSKSSSKLCIAGSYKVSNKKYSVGDRVNYVCDSWTVMKNNSGSVQLIRNSPMNKADVELAGIDTNGTALVDGCNGNACKISHCAWARNNPQSGYCYIYGTRAASTNNSNANSKKGHIAYSWEKSYIKLVLNTYLSNNYLLSQAKSSENLVEMTFSDEIKSNKGYIRVPTMAEGSADNALSWINKSNPDHDWSWTLSKHDNTGPAHNSYTRHYWTIQGYGNTAARIYPVILVKKG